MSFVGLHIHSDYSLLDGASQLDQLVKRAQDLNMPAIALTDHGVMYGAVELLKVCKDKEVNGKPLKPIIGNEMYIINSAIDDPKNTKPKKYHQVTLAKNKQGYKNLVKLTTISHLQGYKGKGIFARPCIDKQLLETYHEGLIVTSACLGGEVPQMILQNKLDRAREVAQWYQNLFGHDYYIEIQDHGSREDRIVNVELVYIAQELGIKIIATNDSHYISCLDVEAHDALLCILTGKRVTDEKRLRYSGTEYLKSADEMRLLFRDHLPDEIIEEAINNTLEVAEKIEEYDILGKPRIPNYNVPEGHTGDSYMAKVARDGLVKRLNCEHYDAIASEYPQYQERLEYEIQMMQQMGFATYFLVVWDYIKFARDQNIPVGPGRGSAAGSLVAYAMEITNIDPVHHGLLFERFLNPERKSMPDIDTDFCIERREDVIKYVTEKYGSDRVAQIITFNRMTSKAVLRDVGRVLNIPLKKVDEMAKMIPISRGKPAKLKEMISEETPEPEFKKKYESEQPIDGSEPPVTYRRWIDMAMRLEGTNKTFGVHAAGVVISADPLDEIVPLQRNNDESVITQYYMEDVEAMGLLKMDFLALKNLTMIQKAVDLIKQYRYEKVDPDQLPLDDPKVYEILAKGDLEGIFQVESSGMRQIVRDLRPSNLDDISSILALYRPGPLDTGMIPQFINRKHGREKIDYAHEILQPVLKETYGLMVYQEQIMRIAQDMAGYSLGQADLLRRAMGKKKLSEMQKHEGRFIEGSVQRGVKKEIAKELWDKMVKFAAYCFNKSHSMAYGYVTFQTAYFKAHYPVEYMAALLTVNSGVQDKVQKYIANCQSMRIQVEAPDINRSGIDFTPTENRILFGFSAIRNVGQGAIEGILAARQKDGPFESLADLCDRVDSTVRNRRVLEALIQSGAMDRFEPNGNRKQLMDDLPLVLDWAQSRAKDRESGQGNLFDFFGGLGASNGNSQANSTGFDSIPKAPPVDDYLPQEKLQKEKELLGFYVSDHPLKAVRQASRVLAPVNISDLEDHASNQSTVSAIVMVPEVKQVTTKKGDKMAILTLEDLSGKVDAVVFPKSFERIGQHIEPDARLMVWGKVDRRDENNLQFIIDDAEPIDAVRMVMVELDLNIANDIQERHRLSSIILANQGDKEQAKVPIIAIINSPHRRQLVRLGAQFRVQNPEVTVRALQEANFEARSSALVAS